MAIGTSTFDLGCLSLFLYGIEEREKIMDIFESVTGARMHLAYYVPGGVVADVSGEVFLRIQGFLDGLGEFLSATKKMALNNRIFMKRTKDVGVITRDMAVSSGISGVNLRASGVDYDIRKCDNPNQYGAYGELDFSTITLDEGDCYARTKLRFLEIIQSIDLIRQCIKVAEPGEVCALSIPSISALKVQTDKTIYVATESPRGEFGVHMIIKNDPQKPWRMHFKSPSFAHIQLLKKLLVGQRIADVAATLGSIDFIMGCCDR
jgi:NADH-quinone oxidoreductase subunit D